MPTELYRGADAPSETTVVQPRPAGSPGGAGPPLGAPTNVAQPTRGDVAGRYTLDMQLTRFGPIETFHATDTWLARRVALALATADHGNALVTTGRSVAGVTSPHVVHVYDCGSAADGAFVVFERPEFTLAFLAREARLYEWGSTEAITTARAVTVGLAALHQAGVATQELHLGSIGIDGTGRVRVSPWALASSSQASNTGDGDLVASVLDTAAPDPSGRISDAMTLAGELRGAIADGVLLSSEDILGILDKVAPWASQIRR